MFATVSARLLTGIAVMGLLVFGLWAVVQTSAQTFQTTPRPFSGAPAVFGTYEVPGGSLTVYSDSTARFTPSAWGEDNLPAYLTDWVDTHNADLAPFGTLAGPDGREHTGCWAAVADTTRVACPDGYTDES